MAAPTWIEQNDRADEDHRAVSPFVQHLADAGALHEAETVWDAEDDGKNPCESISIEEFLAEAKRRRAS